MATLQEYKDKVLEAHPEILIQSLHADIDTVTGEILKLESIKAELVALRDEVNPPAPSMPVEEPAPVAPIEG